MDSEPEVCNFCKDRKGFAKYSYSSEAIALQMAKNSQRNLKVYWCPYGEGWHLSNINTRNYHD